MFEQITQGYTIIRIKQNILLTIKDSNFFFKICSFTLYAEGLHTGISNTCCQSDFWYHNIHVY